MGLSMLPWFHQTWHIFLSGYFNFSDAERKSPSSFDPCLLLCRRLNQKDIKWSHEPWTSSFLWYTLEAFLQRMWFALTMGAAAVLLSALLWTVSLPLVSWNIVRWIASKVGNLLSLHTDVPRKRTKQATFTCKAHSPNFSWSNLPRCDASKSLERSPGIESLSAPPTLRYHPVRTSLKDLLFR